MNTRVLKLSIPVALLVALAAIMLTVASNASADPKHFASGAGSVGFGDHYSFSAHDNPNNPNNPTGFGKFEDANRSIQGPVVCYVQISANTVKFSISAKKVSGDAATQGWTGLLFHVTDNGDPGTAGPDRIGTGVYSPLVGGIGNDPTVCDIGGRGPGTQALVVSGNIVVK